MRAPCGAAAAATVGSVPASLSRRYEVPALDSNGGCPLLDWSESVQRGRTEEGAGAQGRVAPQGAPDGRGVAAAPPAPASASVASVSASPAQRSSFRQSTELAHNASRSPERQYPLVGDASEYYEFDDVLPSGGGGEREMDADLLPSPVAEAGSATRGAIQQLAKTQVLGFPRAILEQLEGLWGQEWSTLQWTEKLAVAQV